MAHYIVTGASRGIGAAVARQLGRAGHAICINYAGNTEAAETVASDVAAAGGKAWLCQADVSDEAQVIALFDGAVDALGPLDGLVNNAGIIRGSSKLEDMTGERIRDVLAVNTYGAILCAREAVKRLSTAHGHGGGAIVNVSSKAATLGSPNEFIDYAASKGAIDALTIGLAKEVATQGIRVNAVRPGLIETDIHASAGDPGRVDRLVGGVPMQRSGSAEEVAETICWLLSDAASYVTGAFLDVSGGR